MKIENVLFSEMWKFKLAAFAPSASAPDDKAAVPPQSSPHTTLTHNRITIALN